MKIFKSALVLTLVGIVCGLLIGTVNMITEPVIQENLLKIARKAYEEFYPELDDLEVVEVKSDHVYEFVKIKADGEVVGYAFRAKGNNPRGVIDTVIAADTSGKILGVKILSTENTPGYYDQYEGKDKYLVGVQGNNLANLEGIDVIGGASQTGDSLDAILKDVAKVAPDYLEASAPELNDYEKLFGVNVTSTVDETFAGTELINKKEYVKNETGDIVGIAYTGKVHTTVIPGKSEGADLVLLVGVKLDGKAAGVVVLLSEHTEDRFEPYPSKLEALAGVDLDDLNVDAVSSATVSANLINEILDEVKILAASSIANLNHELMFGDGVVVEVDDAFVGNEIVTKKEAVKDSEGNLLGYTYTGTVTTTEIPRTDTADLTLMVGVDVSGKVKGLYTVYREHTPGFYDKYNAEFVNVVGVDIADLAVDKIAQSTISHGIIEQVLNAIKGVA